MPLRIRRAGDERVVRFDFYLTGQRGLTRLLKPAIEEARTLWESVCEPGELYVERGPGETEWRLTEHGEQAVQQIANGDSDYLRDFLRTPGVPGVADLSPPFRFVPGAARFVVNGEGHAERVEVVNADSGPLCVHIENLGEVSGPLGDVVRAVEAWFQRLDDAKGQAVGQTQATGKEFGDVSPGAKALALLKQHPDWTMTRLAATLGVSRSTVYRSADFDAVRRYMAMLKTGKSAVPKGRKDPDTGHIEAWRDGEMTDEAG